MARYIDADILLQHWVALLGININACLSIETLKHDLDKIPTADVQPVVHCKDCKYWCHNQGSKDGWCVEGIPINGDDMSRVMVDDYDFCSYAERKK